MFGFFKSKQSKNSKIDEPVEISAHGDDIDVAEIRRRLENRVAELGVQIARKDAEVNKLKDELGDTRRQLEFRASGMDRYQAELQAAYKETESARHTMAVMKEECTKFRQENEDLKEKITRMEAEAEESSEESDSEDDSSGSKSSRRLALEARVAELEEQVAELTREKATLLAAREALDADRQEEVKIIQDALEAAISDKENARSRFEKDYESLRTVNSDREQQMLEDFEWKLRQVEQSAKKRVEEKAKEAEKRSIEIRTELEKEKAAHIKDLERVRRVEAEARELKELTHEQQRLLRVAAREHESVQVNEQVLKEQITRLNAQLDKEKNILSAVQTLNQKKLEEREQVFECRLERQKQEITKEVEHRVRTELTTQHNQDMVERLRQLKEEHAKELAQATKQAQNKIDAAHRQVSALRAQIEKRDADHLREMRVAQSDADQDTMELRRKFDKLDMSYQDRMDMLIEKHNIELEEVERRAGQAELQAGQLRATVELVKEQMARDSEERLANLQHYHRQQLARQHEELSELHAETLAAVRAQHQAELAALVKARSNGDVEAVDPRLGETLNKLRRQDLMIADLSSTIREQDHALTTLTQEKRALQLQLSQHSPSPSPPQRSARENNPPSPVRGLERISECTEPSRDSSMDTSRGSSNYSPVFNGDNRASQSPSSNHNARNSPTCIEAHFSTPCPADFNPLKSRSISPVKNGVYSRSPSPNNYRENSRSPSDKVNSRSPSPSNVENSHCSNNRINHSHSPSPYNSRSPSPQNYNHSPRNSISPEYCPPIIERTNRSPSPIEGSRRSSLSDEFAECQEIQQFVIRLPRSSQSLSPNPISSPNQSSPSPVHSSPPELLVPRAYFLSHSPDPVFPRVVENRMQSRSKSLGTTPFPIRTRTYRASSCPAIPYTSSDEEKME